MFKVDLETEAGNRAVWAELLISVERTSGIAESGSVCGVVLVCRTIGPKAIVIVVWGVKSGE